MPPYEEETVIGKQQFIAELSKLLAGMTARDREAALTKYNEMFDAAPSEEDLLSKLGSPTRTAICELRGYVPSEEPDPGEESPDVVIPDMPSAEAPEAQAAPEGLIEPEPVPDAITEIPEPVPTPDTVDEDLLSAMLPQEPALSGAAAEEIPAPVPGVETLDSIEDPSFIFDISEPHETPPPAKEPRPEVMGGRLTLYILFGIVVCIPVAALMIALCLSVLALGALLISVGIFVISLGFVGITVFADIMLLFGAGLIIAAIGVPIAFFALWLFMRAVVGFVNLILRTGGTWCYNLPKEAQK